MFEGRTPLALGCMGLTGTWNPDEMTAAREKRAIEAFEAALVSGITLYDHADIYGGGTCESVFKKCLEAFEGSRERIQIWTKGGIRTGHFNLSAPYLKECIERSRQRMGIDSIDLYQLHRPDPLAHPAETAAVLNEAVKLGHIKAVGVSNYFPEQTRALQKYLDVPIVSNQIQLHLLRPAPFYEGWIMADGDNKGMGHIGDGTLDFLMGEKIVPLAYSPIAKARLSKVQDDDPIAQDVQDVIGKLTEKYDASRTQIALAWLRTHPSGIIPILGSANPSHIFEAAQKIELQLAREDWYELLSASWGRRMP